MKRRLLQKRIRCPECGRPTVDVRHYVGKNAGDVCYVHTERAGRFGFIDITDSCYVAARDAKTVES